VEIVVVVVVVKVVHLVEECESERVHLVEEVAFAVGGQLGVGGSRAGAGAAVGRVDAHGLQGELGHFVGRRRGGRRTDVLRAFLRRFALCRRADRKVPELACAAACLQDTQDARDHSEHEERAYERAHQGLPEFWRVEEGRVRRCHWSVVVKDVSGVVTGLLLFISEMITPGVSSFSISKFAWLGVTVIICSVVFVVVVVVEVEVVVVVTSNDWAYMNSSMSK